MRLKNTQTIINQIHEYVLYIQVKFGTLFKIQFMHDSGLFRVQFIRISLYILFCIYT
jgi:hypothetical protein